MAPKTSTDEPRDSMSSVSTTSIVFDRLAEVTEKEARRKKKESNPHGYTDDDDINNEDPLKDEQDNDLETGPFLAANTDKTPGTPPQRQPMHRSLKRVIIIAVVVFLLGWFASLAVFLATGSHKHLSDAEHDPDATNRGSGKPVTLDQIQDGYWLAKSHSISWIADPDGQDGLLLEQGAAGKDYLVVGDVRDEPSATHKARTLMKDPEFDYAGKTLHPQWVGPSPDLTKVLLGVHKQKNWRHSFTAVYYILDVATQTVEPLVPLDASARIQLAIWSPKSDAVAFTRDDNNIYVRKLSYKTDTSVVQVTRDGGVECFNGVPDWVYEEEVIGDRIATWWSEDGKHLAFLRTNETAVPDYPLQYFVTGKATDWEGGRYPEESKIKYPKAGAHNPVVEVRFYDVDKDEAFAVEAGNSFPDDDRIINNVMWAGDEKVIVKETNRISDNLKIVLVDVSTRKAKTVRSTDINALDGGWFEISHRMTFVPADAANGREHDGYVDTVIYKGYDHLAYFTPLDSSTPIMLTTGSWEVVDAPSAVDTANNLVYFSATKVSSIQRHIFSVSLLDGSNMKVLTDDKTEGFYSASFSHAAGYMLLSYQGPKIPFQKITTTPSYSGAEYTRTLEENTDLADKARKHALPVLHYGELDLGNGVTVNYIERLPPHFNKQKQYPVLFQQYSGPGSQAVTKKFAVDFSSYIASNLGYIVITVDPRGTGYKGRVHRTPVRGQLGVLEAADHIAAAGQFAQRSYVDASRLCIWGWSYGGFQTLKTLEQDAGATFSYGMAVAPVTDWRLYDSVYAERYMKLPSENEAGYLASSVANATALGESVRFLLMHGVGDDNVHVQNSYILLDELDLAGVENYDVHIFPDSDHSIYYHNANRIVYDSKFSLLELRWDMVLTETELTNWLINAFNGEWLKVSNAKPNVENRELVV